MQPFLSVAYAEKCLTLKQALEVFRDRQWCKKHGLKVGRSGDIAVALGLMAQDTADEIASKQGAYRVVPDICKPSALGPRSRRRSVLLWIMLVSAVLVISFFTAADRSVTTFIAVAAGAIVEVLWRGESTTLLNWRRLVALGFCLAFLTCLCYVVYLSSIATDANVAGHFGISEPFRRRLVASAWVSAGLGVAILLASLWGSQVATCNRARMTMLRSIAAQFPHGCRLQDEMDRKRFLRGVAEVVRFNPWTRAISALLPWWRRQTRIVAVSYLEPMDPGANVESMIGKFVIRDMIVAGHPRRLNTDIDQAVSLLKENYNPAGFDKAWFEGALNATSGEKDKRQAFRALPERSGRISLAGSAFYAKRMFYMPNADLCRSWDAEHLRAVTESHLRDKLSSWLTFSSCLAYPVPIPDQRRGDWPHGVVMILKNVTEGFTPDDKSVISILLQSVLRADSPGASPS